MPVSSKPIPSRDYQEKLFRHDIRVLRDRLAECKEIQRNQPEIETSIRGRALAKLTCEERFALGI